MNSNLEIYSAAKIFIQDGRLPPACFAPSQFGKDAIFKNENVFSSKENTFSSSFSLIFPTPKVSCLFCQIYHIMEVEKLFLKNKTICCAFFSKFITFSDFEKIQDFFEKTVYSLKKHKFRILWEIILFQSHSTANLLPLAISKKNQDFLVRKILLNF